MEAIRKQASKLREQVAKQQQAVLKQFASGLGDSDSIVTSEVELQQHQKLEKLYISTRAGKHLQRDIIRGVEGYIVTGSKQLEIDSKLAESSRKYGAENTSTSSCTLSRAALNYSKARGQIEKERAELLKILGSQVAEPLRAMVTGAPLENARHLAQRYDKLSQETEAQAIEVSRRQAKLRESDGNPESSLKLEAAETKLQELKSNMVILGKEAAAAMSDVEGQQQKLTRQRLITMVEAERNYHKKVSSILDQLEIEILSERKRVDDNRRAAANSRPSQSYDGLSGVFSHQTYPLSADSMEYFFGEVIHPYLAESDVELTLSNGDYVVVRKVSNNGWAEGECQGKAGWFPFSCIERREQVLASKVAVVF
ncbi:SH3 domain-containing protein [Heracleum sosnowskyi]|uniref:SH3 domain-containing protein n=1 Tax=Heracleum sosnowskyi TaxID=360622 RepID=A0AAD8M7G0_9APIA|nr:SH3 domain-containing protein [Heracleum sosnowskyi]